MLIYQIDQIDYLKMKAIEKFLKMEGLAGVALLLATVLALFFANSPFSSSYENFLNTS